MKQQNSYKPAIVLFLVVLICSGLLVTVNSITKPAILKSDRDNFFKVLKLILPSNYLNLEKIFYKGCVIYKATYKNKPTFYAIKTFTDKGFGGKIEVLVSFKKVIGWPIYMFKVLKHNETPGLGDKIDSKNFKKQFYNKPNLILKVNKDGGDIIPLTSATISSRAICDALDKARELIKDYEKNHH